MLKKNLARNKIYLKHRTFQVPIWKWARKIWHDSQITRTFCDLFMTAVSDGDHFTAAIKTFYRWITVSVAGDGFFINSRYEIVIFASNLIRDFLHVCVARIASFQCIRLILRENLNDLQLFSHKVLFNDITGYAVCNDFGIKQSVSIRVKFTVSFICFTTFYRVFSTSRYIRFFLHCNL